MRRCKIFILGRQPFRLDCVVSEMVKSEMVKLGEHNLPGLRHVILTVVYDDNHTYTLPFPSERPTYVIYCDDPHYTCLDFRFNKITERIVVATTYYGGLLANNPIPRGRFKCLVSSLVSNLAINAELIVARKNKEKYGGFAIFNRTTPQLTDHGKELARPFHKFILYRLQSDWFHKVKVTYATTITLDTKDGPYMIYSQRDAWVASTVDKGYVDNTQKVKAIVIIVRENQTLIMLDKETGEVEKLVLDPGTYLLIYDKEDTRESEPKDRVTRIC